MNKMKFTVNKKTRRNSWIFSPENVPAEKQK